MSEKVNANFDMSDIKSIAEIGEKVIAKITDPHGIKKLTDDPLSKIFNDIAESDKYSDDEKLLFMARTHDWKRKKNLEEIILGALPLLHGKTSFESLNSDWLLDFYDKASKITSEEFKIIWSQILAKEANNPNTISKRLLHNLFLMTSQDAESFMNLTKFCFYDVYSDNAYPIIFYAEEQKTYNALGITFERLSSLADLSLIRYDLKDGFSFKSEGSNTRKFLRYTNHQIEVYADKVKCGNVQFTKDGEALFNIVQKRNYSQIIDVTVAKWQEYGYDIRIAK